MGYNIRMLGCNSKLNRKASDKSKKTGFVLGKFLPPHEGHKYLIDFARNYVDKLFVIVGTRKTDIIDGKLRMAWMREMFPDVKLIRVSDRNPEESHPRYWQIWENTLRKALPYIPDYFFASEDYGFKLAKILGCEYVPVNHTRNLVPISATKIRNNPIKYWKYLPSVVRPYYLKRICIYGPESTGKSTLTRNLAKYFKTVYCEEYARPLLDFTNGKFDYSDITRIARGHTASEKALASHANKVLFIDTDLVLTSVLSKMFFKKCPRWVYENADKNNYDLYLVTNIDVPWVGDNQRFFPNKRKWYFDLCVSELKRRRRRYKIISGTWDERLKKSINAVKSLLV
jgi:HTH-type transcriptional regulator, transcriptional repressor of NAD biosynthesis genes